MGIKNIEDVYFIGEGDTSQENGNRGQSERLCHITGLDKLMSSRKYRYYLSCGHVTERPIGESFYYCDRCGAKLANQADSERWHYEHECCGEPRGFVLSDPDNFGRPSCTELWCEHCDIELDVEWAYCPKCGKEIRSDLI